MSVTTSARPRMHPLLKLVLELGPLALFFLATNRPQLFAPLMQTVVSPAMLNDPTSGPIFTATPIFMVATAASLIAGWFLTRHIPIMPLVSGAFVLVFGALTMWLESSLFIKIKPTIVNTLFGAILLGGLWFGKPLLRYVLDVAFNLTEEGWRILTLRWGIFFLFLAVLNEVVWRNFTEAQWTGFKLYGVMPITILFGILQMPVLMRYEAKADAGGS